MDFINPQPESLAKMQDEPKKPIDLTHQYIKSLFNYDRARGILTWASRSETRNKGIAGSIDRLGIRRVNIDGKKYHATDIIWMWMTGTFPSFNIDFVNNDPQNLKWENLTEESNCEELISLNSHEETRVTVGKNRFIAFYRGDKIGEYHLKMQAIESLNSYSKRIIMEDRKLSSKPNDYYRTMIEETEGTFKVVIEGKIYGIYQNEGWAIRAIKTIEKNIPEKLSSSTAIRIRMQREKAWERGVQLEEEQLKEEQPQQITFGMLVEEQLKEKQLKEKQLKEEQLKAEQLKEEQLEATIKERKSRQKNREYRRKMQEQEQKERFKRRSVNNGEKEDTMATVPDFLADAP